MGAEITGDAFFSDGFSATGGVRLPNAKVGQLDCSGAMLTNEEGDALVAYGAEITGDVFFIEGSAPPAGCGSTERGSGVSLTARTRGWSMRRRLRSLVEMSRLVAH
jgi:hypothetical protein